jgi:hypothetical protein
MQEFKDLYTINIDVNEFHFHHTGLQKKGCCNAKAEMLPNVGDKVWQERRVQAGSKPQA